jgi:hypothetical protein
MSTFIAAAAKLDADSPPSLGEEVLMGLHPFREATYPLFDSDLRSPAKVPLGLSNIGDKHFLVPLSPVAKGCGLNFLAEQPVEQGAKLRPDR